MAKQQILNLDAILSEVPQRTIVYKGQEYAIAGATAAVYLKFLERQQKISAAIEAGDNAAQWENSLELIALLAPGLPLDDMQTLPIGAFQQVVEFVIATFQQDAEGGDSDGASEAGE